MWLVAHWVVDYKNSTITWKDSSTVPGDHKVNLAWRFAFLWLKKHMVLFKCGGWWIERPDGISTPRSDEIPPNNCYGLQCISSQQILKLHHFWVGVWHIYWWFVINGIVTFCTSDCDLLSRAPTLQGWSWDRTLKSATDGLISRSFCSMWPTMEGVTAFSEVVGIFMLRTDTALYVLTTNMVKAKCVIWHC